MGHLHNTTQKLRPNWNPICVFTSFPSLCGLFCQDSVICLEEDQTATLQTAPEKNKTQKSLRSLNDVLGKASPVCKETKPVPGSLSHSKSLFHVWRFVDISSNGAVISFSQAPKWLLWAKRKPLGRCRQWFLSLMRAAARALKTLRMMSSSGHAESSWRVVCLSPLGNRSPRPPPPRRHTLSPVPPFNQLYTWSNHQQVGSFVFL